MTTHEQDPRAATETKNAKPLAKSPLARYGFLIGIPSLTGMLLGLVVIVFQWLQRDEAKFFWIGMDGMQVPIACVLLFVVANGLVFTFAPSLRRKQLLGLGCMTVTALLLSTLFRVETYYGNRVPKWTWRWKPTSEEASKQYFVSSNRKQVQLEDSVSRPMLSIEGASFPGLMGAEQNGTIVGTDPSFDWQGTPPRVLWRHPVGLGWSSFAIAGEAAITLEQRDDRECVVCYHLLSGDEWWCHDYATRFRNEYGDGPRTTPAISGNLVLTMGGAGDLCCIEIPTGKLRWQKQVISANAKPLYFGTSISPLIVGDQVIVTPGVEVGASAIAYALQTGEERWRVGNDPGSYASPVYAKVAGIEQVLSFNGEGLRSYSLDGRELWLHPWQTQGDSRVNVAQPIVLGTDPTSGATSIVISSGYDRGTALLQVTLADGEWSTSLAWTSNQLKSKLSNFVIRSGHAYGFDNGMLTCLDLQSGRRTWKRGRYGHGQALVVAEHLLLQTESGAIVVVATDPREHREVASYPALDSKTWNHLALAGNILVARNDREAVALELPTRASPSK